MKNLFTKMMLVAVAAMTFIGCSQEPTEINATVKKTTIELTANIDEVTRSYFGEEVTEGGATSFPSLWEGNESVKLVAYGEADAVIAQAYGTVEAEEGSATARISATFEGELTGVVKLGAYVGGWSYMEPGVVELPEEQFMSKDGTVASNAHIMSAEVAWDGTPASLELNFAHEVAYGKMTIKECPVAVEDIAKVIVALDTAIYTVQLGDLITSTDIWFACEATEEFATLKVSVVDNNGVTYSKSVDMSVLADNQRLKFKTGEVSKFSIKGLTREAADHVIEFTEMSGPVSEYFGSWEGTGMKYTLSNAAGDTMQITFSEADGNPLKAGTYTCSISKCEDGCFYGNGTWIKLAGAEWETYIGAGEVVVEAEGNLYTVTYTGTIGGESYETTFTDFNEGVYEAEIDTVVGGGSSTNFNITFTTTDGADFGVYELRLEFSAAAADNGLLPAGTYTFGADSGNILGGYASPTGEWLNLTAGTVVVEQGDKSYTFTIDVTNLAKTQIKATYTGRVEGQWGEDFLHKNDAVKLATPQNVNYTIEGTSAIITWDAVDNAESYLVTYNETEETTDTNSFTFTTEPDTYYNVSVVAVPATGSTLYKNSDAGYASFTTPKDINAAADYNVTLTKITAISGNTINFQGDDSKDRMKLQFNSGLTSIEAGTYNVVYNKFSSASALEVMSDACYNIAEAFSESYEYFINAGDLVNVAKNGDEYTITVVCSTWINSLSAMKSVKLTYTGKLEVTSGGEVDEGIVFTSATATARNSNWYDVTFTDGTNTLAFGIGNGGKNYWGPGKWNSNNLFSSGFALDYPLFNDVSATLIADVEVDENNKYVISFSINNGAETATFNGEITGLGFPPAPGAAVELTAVCTVMTDYNGDVEFHFTTNEGKELLVDFFMSGFAVGTYDTSDLTTLITNQYGGSTLTSIEFIMGDNGTEWTFDVTFSTNGIDFYHFTTTKAK